VGSFHGRTLYYRRSDGCLNGDDLQRKPLNIRTGFAALAAIVGAIAVWSAAPAVADQTVAQAQPVTKPLPSPSPSPTPSPAPHLLQVSGFADAGYTSASIASGLTPAGGGKQITAGPSNVFPYVFDTLNQEIQFHNFNVQVAYNGPIGGKIEMSFGDDANIINSYPKSFLAPGTSIDMTQAYLSGTSGQFTGIVGKFETLAGAEVIESPNDMNFSRSILFGYAVPFTHTGGRLTWAATPTLNIIAGLNNGWDTTRTLGCNNGQLFCDSNALTIEGGAAWNPSKAFGVTLQGYTGQVPQGSAFATPGAFTLNPARPQRSLVDTVITYHATPALTLVLNGDAGQQTNSNYLDNTGALVGYGTGTWSGVAGYASYAITSAWTAALRLEYMADYGGLRTGLTQRWGEGTVTVQYSPNSNIIVRGEVRGDKSNALFFNGPGGNRYNTNAQFGIETIVKWP
jgi:hypothetical protein